MFEPPARGQRAESQHLQLLPGDAAGQWEAAGKQKIPAADQTRQIHRQGRQWIGENGPAAALLPEQERLDPGVMLIGQPPPGPGHHNAGAIRIQPQGRRTETWCRF